MAIQVNTYWQRLKESPKFMVGAGIVVLVIAYVLWSSWLNHNNLLRSEIKVQQQTLVWMQPVDKEIRQRENQRNQNKIKLDNVGLLSYLQQQITQAGFETESLPLKETMNNRYAIHLEQVSFDKFIAMLAKTLSEQSLTVDKLTIVASGQPGMVSIDLILF